MNLILSNLKKGSALLALTFTLAPAIFSCKIKQDSAPSSNDSNTLSTNAANQLHPMCQRMHLNPCTVMADIPLRTQVTGKSGVVSSKITEMPNGDGSSQYILEDIVPLRDMGTGEQTQQICTVYAVGPSKTGFEIPGNPMTQYYAPINRIRQDPRFKIITDCKN